MNLVKLLKNPPQKPSRILAIDSSTRSLALALYERRDGKAYLLNTSKLDMLKAKTQRERFLLMNSFLDFYANEYGPITTVVIEQPIYIQNPETSRKLAQIVGATMGRLLGYCDDVREVTISEWKAFIGYKNVSKKEKDAWTVELGATESKKKAAYERKQRTIEIVHTKIENISHIDDNDICDAIGIGLWAIENV